MPLNESLEKIKDLNFGLITINFHPSDMDQFNNFLTTYFLPYIIEAPLYALTTEFNTSLSRHLHCVVGYDKKFARDIYTIKNKLNAKKVKLNLIKIYNTDECAFDVKTIQDDTKDEKVELEKRDTKWGHIFTSIGYCVKQGTGYLQTNIKDTELLEQSRLSYINKMKKPIVSLDNNYEHKQLSKGNILNHLYDASIKHPEIPIIQLENYTIKHMKYSYANVTQYTKRQVLKELYIIRSNDQKIYEKYGNDDFSLIYPHKKSLSKSYEEYSYPALVEQCVKLEETISKFQEMFEKVSKINNKLQNVDLSIILNEKYYFL